MNEYKVLNAFEFEGVMQEVGAVINLTVEQASADGIVGNVEAVNLDAGTASTTQDNGMAGAPTQPEGGDNAAAPTADAPVQDAPATPAADAPVEPAAPAADSANSAAPEATPAPEAEQPKEGVNFVGKHSVSGE